MSYQVIPPGHVVEITIRVEQGLLMPANALVMLIIEAAIARAQQLHPLIICHYLVEPTHIHFLILVKNPEDVPGFTERFKTESAHYINSMLGRVKRTVWCEGYFCAPILTPSSVRKKIAYIYSNPAKDGLEDSINLYPGLSSWSAYRSGRHKKLLPRINRTIIPYMPESSYPQHRYRTERKKIKKLAQENQYLTLTPDAWMKPFGIPEQDRQKENEKVLRLILQSEEKFRQTRKGPVIGALALKTAHLETEYLPKKHGKRVWCISDNTELRIRYIEWAKEVKQKARAVYERWKIGDFTVPFPPGVFPPTRPLLANFAPAAVQY